MKKLTNTLKTLIAERGTEILQQEQLLKALRADCLPQEKRMQYLLELSIIADTPNKLNALRNEKQATLDTQIRSMKKSFKEDYFLEDGAVKLLFDFWIEILLPEMPYNDFDIVWDSGFCGLKNSKGIMVTDFIFDDAKSFRNDLALVMIKKKYGLINKNGYTTLPIIYDKIYNFYNNDYAVVECNNKVGFINSNGWLVVPPIYEKGCDLYYFYNDKDIRKANLNGKFGCINYAGKEVISCKYDFIYKFNNDRFIVKLHGKYGLIDLDEKIHCDFKYNSVKTLINRKYALVEVNNKWGIVDEDFEELIPIKYESIDSFYEGFAKVKVNGLWGFVTEDGDEIIKPKYDDVNEFSEGLSSFRKGNKWGLLNTEGVEIIENKYDSIEQFRDGLAVAMTKTNNNLNKYGCLDKSGLELIPVSYDYVNSLPDGYVEVELDGKWGCYNKKGVLITPLKYELNDPSDNGFNADFHDGIARVILNDEYGFIDTFYKEIITPKYDYATDFINGLAIVKELNHYFAINKFEEIIIPEMWEWAGCFNWGYAIVKYDYSGNTEYFHNMYGFIDMTGEVKISLEFEDAKPFCEGLACVKRNHRYGYINLQDQTIIDFKYIEASNLMKT